MGDTPKARIVGLQVRCATPYCSGKFGTLLGSSFRHERGFQPRGGRDEGGRLVGVTWEPTPHAQRGWSQARQQLRLKLVAEPAREKLRKRVAEGLNSFSRDARMTDGFVASRQIPGLPAFVRCYDCGKECEIEAPSAM
jgi:hypothetical protein